MPSFTSNSFSTNSFSALSFFIDGIIDVVIARDESGIYGKLKNLQKIIREYEIVRDKLNNDPLSIGTVKNGRKNRLTSAEKTASEFNRLLLLPFVNEITPKTEIVKLGNGSFSFVENAPLVEKDSTIQNELIAELTAELLKNLSKPMAIKALDAKKKELAEIEESEAEMQMILNILMMIDV